MKMLKKLIEERNEARRKQDFARADEIRDMLKSQNIILETHLKGLDLNVDNQQDNHIKLLNPLTLAYMETQS